MTNDDIARTILDGTAYVVLATADPDGVPWASPVWFATTDYRELYWISHPDARHSENIATRPEIGATVFDSTVPPDSGQAVYLTARAERVTDPDHVARGIAVFSAVSTRRGGRTFDAASVSGDARLRLYRATVHQHWILDPDSPHDVRVAVTP